MIESVMLVIYYAALTLRFTLPASHFGLVRFLFLPIADRVLLPSIEICIQ